MIEAPEARILCRQLNETVRGKKITDVYTQFSPHKFAWFTGSSEEYAEQLSGKTIDHAQSQGGMVEITIGDKVLILTDRREPCAIWLRVPSYPPNISCSSPSRTKVASLPP